MKFNSYLQNQIVKTSPLAMNKSQMFKEHVYSKYFDSFEQILYLT